MEVITDTASVCVALGLRGDLAIVFFWFSFIRFSAGGTGVLIRGTDESGANKDAHQSPVIEFLNVQLRTCRVLTFVSYLAPFLTRTVFRPSQQFRHCSHKSFDFKVLEVWRLSCSDRFTYLLWLLRFFT